MTEWTPATAVLWSQQRKLQLKLKKIQHHKFRPESIRSELQSGHCQLR